MMPRQVPPKQDDSSEAQEIDISPALTKKPSSSSKVSATFNISEHATVNLNMNVIATQFARPPAEESVEAAVASSSAEKPPKKLVD